MHKVNFLSSKQTAVKVSVQSAVPLHVRRFCRIPLTVNGERLQRPLLGVVPLGGDTGEDCADVALGGCVLEGGVGDGQACRRVDPGAVGNDHGCRREEQE